jgi:hypothetical protein
MATTQQLLELIYHYSAKDLAKVIPNCLVELLEERAWVEGR